MNQTVHDLLEQHFDKAFAAPDGIAKLRELILTLAMQGKLVEQDPADPPASELLKEIEAEKQLLISERKIKKPKPLPSIRTEELPYEAPKGWVWLRLPECYFGIGNKSNQIQSKDYLERGQFPIVDQGKNFVNGYYDDESKVLHLDRPVIVFGDHTKNIKYIDFDFVIGADGVKVLCPFTGVSTRFLYRLIQSFDLTDRGYARHFKVLNEKLAPLPPLAEQHRIVARIDQLMARCDELEKLRKDREEKRLKVHAAAIKQLLDAPENTGWPFIQQHFGELYTVKENVAELRKAILQLAVMGRLVPQDPNDPPASELLKEIEAEKQRLIAEKKIKKQKPLPPIKPEEVPYELPHGWEWVRLGSVMQFINGDRGKNYPSKDKLSSEGIPFISAVNLKNGTVSKEDLLCVSEEQYAKLGSGKLKTNDLVFCIRGSLGKKAIYPFERGAIASSLVILRSYLNADDFLRFTDSYMASPFLFSEIRKYDNGTAQPNLSANNFMQFLLPLPPLPEQRRILACIDQLMELCGRLDLQIEAATSKQEALLNAVMAQV